MSYETQSSTDVPAADPEQPTDCSHEAPFDYETEPLVALHCLSHTYPDGTAGVHDVSFAVHPDETVGLIGGNGAGKSTLMEHLNGLLDLQEGALHIDGTTITGDTIDVARREVGFVFQDADSQIVAPTVLDDVMFGPLNYGASQSEAKDRAIEALDRLDASHLADRVPHHLSGGEKRLVAIAGVLAMDPSVIVMDEPLAGLDPAREQRVRGVIESLQSERIALVIATHDVDFAADISDRLVVMDDGDIVGSGPPTSVFYDGELLERANLRPPTAVRMARPLGVTTQQPVTEHELLELLEQSRGE